MEMDTTEEAAGPGAETLAEVIADLRSAGICEWDGIADRLEAAWKREREDIELNVTRITRNECRAEAAEENAVGNAAAMREALEVCLDFIMRLDRAFNPFMQNLLENAIAKARAALAAPPRNCDAGTAEKQDKRFTEVCKANSEDGVRGICSETCPFGRDYQSECALAWALCKTEEGDRNA